MSAHLLDVNVLVALAWPNHVHHARAHRWLAEHGHSGWATCPVTQSGFVRVSSNRRAIPGARSTADAVALLQRIVQLPDHQFWHDDVSIAWSEEVPRKGMVGYRQVTDGHLLALATRRSGRLATFDRGVQELAGQGASGAELVTLIP